METIKFNKEDLKARAEEYLKLYNEDWEGYEDALDFAEDGAILAKMILSYLENN